MHPVTRKKAREMVADIRSKPMRLSVSEDVVTNLVYFIEEAMKSLDAQEGETAATIYDGVVTVGQLQDIMAEIDDPNLSAYFVRVVNKGLSRRGGNDA